MPIREEKRRRFESNESAWRLATAVAVVSGLFSFIVCILLIAHCAQMRAMKPLDDPVLLQLRQQLADASAPDEELVERIRALDLLARKAFFKAWFSSALTIVGATFYGVIGLFPNMFPSNINVEYSLSAYNSASSPLTLKIMLIVVIIFVPIVLAYQFWTYNLFKGKLTKEDMVY